MSAGRRIVLYFPQHYDPRTGASAGKDLLPLSVLTIAGLPDREGYEVVVVDGNLYPEEEAHRRVVEACQGALLYGTTGILGYQVADAYRCSRRVRAAHPELKTIIGGWFASVMPELQLRTGLYDAVALGQGELTFLDVVHAVECGEPLDGVPGLALLRDGEPTFTERRAVAGWDRLVDCPWHLIDIAPYRDAQLTATPSPLDRERQPPPPGRYGKPFWGISYFSSFGCPEPCTFCCSPEVSGLRWKCMPADRMLDDLCDLEERWKFDTVRFHDANWGVAEKRVRAFCEGLLERNVHFWWFAMMQAFSILRYGPETLAALRDSGLYAVGIGGETGDADTLASIGKQTLPGDNYRAALIVDELNIASWMTYIVGYPDESPESMMNTVDECRRIVAATDLARPTVWPYRPIPGSALFARAVELGYRPPSTVEEWGEIGPYHVDETWVGKVPEEVSRARQLFEHYSTLSLGLPRGRVGWWERRARRRLKRGDFRLGRVEAKAFDVYSKLAGRLGFAGAVPKRGYLTGAKSVRM